VSLFWILPNDIADHSSLYTIPLFFQFAKGNGALDAGVRLLPYILVMVFFVILNGGLMGKFGYYMPWYMFGGICVTLGSALMYTVNEHTPTARIYGYSIIAAIGAGSYLQASYPVVQAKVSPNQIPAAVAFISMAQIMGLTHSLSIGDALFLNEAQTQIRALFPNLPLAEI
jgi:hypothetical protein